MTEQGLGQYHCFVVSTLMRSADLDLLQHSTLTDAFFSNGVRDHATDFACSQRRLDTTVKQELPRWGTEGADDQWDRLTYQQLGEQVCALASYFDEIGVSKGTPVAIWGNPRREWIISQFATLQAGGFIVPPYASDSIGHAGFKMYVPDARIVVAQNQQILDQLHRLCTKPFAPQKGFPDRQIDPLQIDHVIVMEDEFYEPHSLRGKCVKFSEILTSHSGQGEIDTFRSLNKQDICALYYSSATTGMPKAVAHSHGHILVNLQDIVDSGIVDNVRRIMAMLPYSHIYAGVTGIVPTVTGEGEIIFTRSVHPDHCHRTKETRLAIREDLSLAQIHLAAVVPEVFFQTIAGLRAKVSGRCNPLHYLARSTVTKASQRWLHENDLGEENPKSGWLQNRVLGKMRAAFGNDWRVWISGGQDLPDWARAVMEGVFDTPVLQGLGHTEFGIASAELMGERKLGSCGKPFSRVEVDAVESDLTDRFPDRRELVFKRDHMPTGYFGGDRAKPFYDPVEAGKIRWQDGWYHSRDFGQIDEDGFVFHEMRGDDAIIFSNGNNIDPGEIEEAIDRQLEVYRSTVGLHSKHGENEYLVAVVSLNPGYEPSEGLAKKILDELNQPGTKKNEMVKAIVFSDVEFSIQTGFIGPSEKVRRLHVLEHFNKQIQSAEPIV